MHGVEIAMRDKKKTTVGRIKYILRAAEKASGTGGTGATILKLKASPIVRLVEQHRVGPEKDRIGPEELQAAMDISAAFFALSGALMIRPLSWEKQDRSHGTGHWPQRVAEAVRNYQRFASHWSIRAKLGDPTLEIVIAAVVDERPLSVIEADIGIRHGKASKALVSGLRDYAARSGFVTGRKAQAWLDQARMVFPVRHPDLSLAMARAGQTDI